MTKALRNVICYSIITIIGVLVILCYADAICDTPTPIENVEDYYPRP